MRKNIVVDFYQVESPVPFENVLRSVMNIGHGGMRRNEQTTGGIIRLRKEGERDGLIFGDMMRIHQDEPTIVAHTNGNETAVAEGEDEGLGATNAFLYIPDRKVIAYQRNRSGVSASRASFYFQQKGNVSEAILFNPVMVEDIHRKLGHLSGARKLRIKMAPGHLPEGQHDGPLIGLLRSARRMESPVIDVTFSLGRTRRGTLDLNNMREAIRWTEDQHNEGMAVDALELVAQEEGAEKPEILDLLGARLRFSQQIESSKLIEEFYRRRLDVLFEAWSSSHRKIPRYS